jgi:hypothetical protein
MNKRTDEKWAVIKAEKEAGQRPPVLIENK